MGKYFLNEELAKDWGARHYFNPLIRQTKVGYWFVEEGYEKK